MSELKDREEGIRAMAAKCRTITDLMKKSGLPIQTVILANEMFNLGLTELRLDRPPSRRVAEAVPKPVGKPKPGDKKK